MLPLCRVVYYDAAFRLRALPDPTPQRRRPEDVGAGGNGWATQAVSVIRNTNRTHPGSYLTMDLNMLSRKHWRIADRAPSTFIRSLPEMHAVVTQVLYNRGYRTADAVDRFLNADHTLRDLSPLEGIAEAVGLVREVIREDQLIVVYGDYDVDGVTAAAVLVETLQSLGAQVKPYIPSREDEGYGLNVEAIQALVEEGARLLITVDCGTRSVDEIAMARDLGLHVIVTDHHHVGARLPPADVVVNPKRGSSTADETNCEAPDLAGVGVAFRLAHALIRENRRDPLPTTQADLMVEHLLDLVALGTVSDMVSLQGENHTLVTRGLESLNQGHRPGLSALMSIAGVNPGKVTTKTIGFVLSPRLNAAGRIDEAITALDLLLAPDMASALPLAHELDALNYRRRQITSQVRERVRELVLTKPATPPLIFAASEAFSSGVVGLAASRLVDEFYRPAVVVAIEGEYSKGSARSIPEFHITQALDALDGLLERHGGHAAAAGFTVKTTRLGELERRLTGLAEAELGDLALTPSLTVDAEVALGDLSWDLYHQLERLQPFGFGNPTPILVSRHARVLSARAVGSDGRHLKLYVADEKGTSWDAIAFRQGDWIGRIPSWIDLAYVLEMNEWNGRISLQLNVQDIHVPYG